jgi:hypothetical protein
VTDLFSIAANRNIPAKKTEEDRLNGLEILSVPTEIEVSISKNFEEP